MSFWRKRLKAATFLGQLRRDVRGNTLAIMAAALIPMIAMVGSGVDMTRAYMAQNRLSQACDAGSLAGRRLLAGTNVTPAIRDEATKYFAFNFPQGQFQANPYTLTITAPQTGTLHVETATTVPTTLMKFFGFQTLDIKASCSATQDFVNTDIAMVFDVSGSMNCAPANVNGGDCNGVEESGSKIQALRDAAIAFYDALQPAQDQLHANSLRLRYGFVNYNSAVNVGRLLYAKNPDFLVQQWHYQSREPRELVNAAPYGLNNSDQCRNAYLLKNEAQSLGYQNIMGGYWNHPAFSGISCGVIGVRSATDPDAYLDGYRYGSVNVDVRRYLAATADTPDPQKAHGEWVFGTDYSHYDFANNKEDERPTELPEVWPGCIEERQTNNTTINGGSGTTAPVDAWDLDVDKVPNTGDGDASRWRPMWPELELYPDWATNGKPFRVTSYCPSEARRLREYYNDRASFASYVNGLRAIGSTYHDLGVIWGARFLSPDGIFKSATPITNNVNDPDNPTKIRGFSVKKYMIFMTDGQMQPSTTVYSSYGVEALDGRVMGAPSNNNGALTQRHLQRFRMACNAAKSKGIDIWVVAFGTTLTSDMTNCASKPEQAASVADRATLIAKFQEIGSKIGSLRLSQ